MRIALNVYLAALGVSLPLLAVAAENKPALTDQKSKISYGLGMNIGNNLKRGGIDLDPELVAAAVKDVLAGHDLKMTEAEAREALTAYQKEVRAKQDELRAKAEEERVKKAETNKLAGAAFLAENKNKPGVKVHPVTLPDGTTAELQYKVITEGTGEIPKSNDTVSVNYKGTLINGKEFDSTASHGDGKPSEFQVTRVIKGWTEALQLMKTGSKWTLYIPSSLAYGDRAFGQTIEPGSTLIFDIELLSTKASPAPAPVQPLTSDIIRVPSAEGLKKGEKIEVIKPEDVEKQIKAEAAKSQETKPQEKKP